MHGNTNRKVGLYHFQLKDNKNDLLTMLGKEKEGRSIKYRTPQGRESEEVLQFVTWVEVFDQNNVTSLQKCILVPNFDYHIVSHCNAYFLL